MTTEKTPEPKSTEKTEERKPPREVSEASFKRIYETAVQILAHRQLGYADREEISRALKIAEQLDTAVRESFVVEGRSSK